MFKHKVSLLILVSALTVTAAMPAFASSKYHTASWDDYDHNHDYYGWEDYEDYEDGDEWGTYNFNGEKDHQSSAERDALETEWAINSKTNSNSNSQSYDKYNDNHYAGDDYYFYDGGPGYPGIQEGSYGQISDPSLVQSGWVQDERGWYYVTADYTYPKDQWLCIKDEWYYFDEEGYMKTGLIVYNNKIYYCDAEGKMITNKWSPEGYYFGEDGAMVPNP